MTAIKLPSSRREHVQWWKVEPISLCEPKVWKFLLVWFVILCVIGSLLTAVICNFRKGFLSSFSPPFISFPFPLVSLHVCLVFSVSQIFSFFSTLISRTLLSAPSESHPSPSFFLHPSLCYPDSFYFFSHSFAIQDLISYWYFSILIFWVALPSPTLRVNNAFSTRFSLLKATVY